MSKNRTPKWSPQIRREDPEIKGKDGRPKRVAVVKMRGAKRQAFDERSRHTLGDDHREWTLVEARCQLKARMSTTLTCPTATKNQGKCSSITIGPVGFTMRASYQAAVMKGLRWKPRPTAGGSDGVEGSMKAF